MNNKNGFTFMELMIVIAIIAIVSAVTIPNMIGWSSNRRIQGAVDNMSAVFQSARQRAIRENQDVVILPDTGNNTCEVFIDANSDRAIDAGEARLQSIVLPEGVNMYHNGFDDGWFGYTGQGLPILNKAGELYLKNTAGRYMGIQMDITGNPIIIQSDNNGSSWY